MSLADGQFNGSRPSLPVKSMSMKYPRQNSEGTEPEKRLLVIVKNLEGAGDRGQLDKDVVLATAATVISHRVWSSSEREREREREA